MLTRLKEMRLRAGLRQFDVSREVGVSETTLSKYETGRVIPSDELRERIAAVLGVRPEELLEEVEDENHTPHAV